MMRARNRGPLPRLLLGLTAAAVLVAGWGGTAHAVTARCTAKEVFVHSNRIHVQCTTGVADGSATILYLAVSTADAALANRFLTLGTSAVVSRRRFVANFTAGDTSGTSFGCGSSDCRKVTSFGLE